MAKRTERGGDLVKIDALEELRSLNVEYKEAGEDEVLLLCPAHEDNTPSCSLNVESNLFRCPVCDFHGSIYTLIHKIRGGRLADVMKGLQEKYGISDTRAIRPSIYEGYHTALIRGDCPDEILESLKARGITKDIMRLGRIGWHEGRVTIPVLDMNGRCINIRRYLPGAPSRKKFVNTPGMTPTAIYRVADTKFPAVWICGGELKALASAPQLNQLGVGSVAITGTEGHWEERFNLVFTDKVVFICMDIDKKGNTAARQLAYRLNGVAKEVRIIRLPLDSEAFPKGDLNDWISSQSPSLADYRDLMKTASVYERDIGVISKDPMAIEITSLFDDKNSGQYVRFPGMVAALDQRSWTMPKKVAVKCTRDQAMCHECPVSWESESSDAKISDDGSVEVNVSLTARSNLELVQIHDAKVRKPLAESIGIPPTCKVWESRVTEEHRVVYAQIGAQIDDVREDLSDENTDWRTYEAMIIGSPRLNEVYEFTGVAYPHPRDQHQVALVTGYEELEDTLSAHDPDPEELKALEFFRPDEWTLASVLARLRARYADLEANVTLIHNRFLLHLVMDLTWHSVIQVRLPKRTVNAWLNTLVIGDTGVGKTEASTRLMAHYRLGTRAVAKRASVAGILGGLQQYGSRWMVSWGVVPRHDRRLVILEELKGLDVDEIAQLTDMRSSGVAQLVKVEESKAPARTRILGLTNPRRGDLSQKLFKIESMVDLIGAPEDMRRFDLVLVAPTARVEYEAADVPHTHKSTLCRDLIFWVWSRKGHDIQIVKGEEARIAEMATGLTKTFGCSQVPIMAEGVARDKILRVAAAFAAMTFSTRDYESLLIRDCHVDAAEWLFNELYRERSGLANLCQAERLSNTLGNVKKVESILSNSGIRSVVEVIKAGGTLDRRLPGDRVALDRIIDTLLSERCYRLAPEGLVPTPSFIKHLRQTGLNVKSLDQMDTDDFEEDM